jgi:large subunit ribosomal protein L4
MPTVDLLNQENKKVGTVDLRDEIFATEVNVALVHQVIKAQLAGRRQGTVKTKTKGEVRGGGRKPFRQKGTGNARQGSSRSPLHPGGGQTFGPLPRNWDQSTPKEMMRGALRSALSDRFKSERVRILDKIVVSGKTKELQAVLGKKFQLENVLIVDGPTTTGTPNLTLERSGRNLKGVRVLRAQGINVYDIVKYEWLLLTQAAVNEIEKKLEA